MCESLIHTTPLIFMRRDCREEKRRSAIDTVVFLAGSYALYEIGLLSTIGRIIGD